MSIKLAVIMDPLASLQYHKDSTLALLQEAQDRQYEIYFIEHLFYQNHKIRAHAPKLKLFKNAAHFYELGANEIIAAEEFDIILVRKDPPFDETYLYLTQLLSLLPLDKVRVINDPQSLRDANEKIYANHFPHLTPPTLISNNVQMIQEFCREQKEIVCKPLNKMGGRDIFRLRLEDANFNAIVDGLTAAGQSYICAQRYLPEIKAGDRRILLIHGEPIPYALARIPAANDWRGNLAQGASANVAPLTAREKIICQELKSDFIKRNFWFVGIDVIGDFLTEINVTSPTGIREIEAATNINIAAKFFDSLT